jgi:drug/metabolite transporter (DMT)-like permease
MPMKFFGKYLPYLALTAMCLIWGTTYLALRIAVVDFPAFLFTGIRQSIAGLLLLGFMFIVGKKAFPDKAQLIRQSIAGFFMLTLGNGLVAWGETHVPSGVAAIICSLMPVVVIIINLLSFKDEKPNAPIMIGVVLGLIGIVMIFGEHINEFSKSQYVGGTVAIFSAVIAWAGGSIWIKKKNTESNPFVNAGLQMFFGGLWCFPMSFVMDDFTRTDWTVEAVYSLIYLIVFGSIIAYASYAYVLRKLLRIHHRICFLCICITKATNDYSLDVCLH